MAGGMGEMIMTKRLKNVFYGLFAAALTVSLGVLAAVNLPVRAQENAGTFAMETGAEIRLEEPSGLRFITKVDQAFIDGLKEANPEAKITFGTEIVPAGREDVEPLDIPQTVWAEESTETVKCFKAVLTKIPDTQYLTKLTATAYYAVDGAKTYVSNPQTRSVAYVASAALAAGQEDPVYTSIVDKAVPAISLGEDFSLNVGGEKTLAAEGAEGLVVKFSSDNDEIATVDENGVVRAVGAGTANITAALGSRTDSVAVTVNAVKKLFYSFEEEEVGSIYDKTLFASKDGAWDYLKVGNLAAGCTDGKQGLYRNAEGSGYPHIIIKNSVLTDFYNAYGGISFDLYNNGSLAHNGYWSSYLNGGTQNYYENLAPKTGVTITVDGEILKSIVDSGNDLAFCVLNNDAICESNLEYYLDNVRGAAKDMTVEKGETLSAADLLGTNATLKSFTVYKDGEPVTDEGAESYTFTEYGDYTFECVQSIEGYEDSTVKGSVKVLDEVFDSVEEWVGADKLIASTYSNVAATEYLGATMLRMESSGAYPRIELNKDMVKAFIDEGKTLTLVFKLGNVDGDHKTYVGNKVAHASIVSGEKFAEISITPEKWSAIEEEIVAEKMERIYVITLAHVEGGSGGENSDPFTMYYAGYILS